MERNKNLLGEEKKKKFFAERRHSTAWYGGRVFCCDLRIQYKTEVCKKQAKKGRKQIINEAKSGDYS